MPGSVILIVVEGAAERASLNASFSSSPHHLVFAGDGADALARFSEVKPDLVLAEARARRLEGGALIRKIRLLPRGHDVPMLLLAPDAELAAGQRAAEAAEADGVLGLPLDPDGIVSRLAPLLTLGRLASLRARPSSIATVADDHLPTQGLAPASEDMASDRATDDLGERASLLDAPIPMPRIDFDENTDVGVESPFVARTKEVPHEVTRLEAPSHSHPEDSSDVLVFTPDESTTAEAAAQPAITEHDVEDLEAVESHTLSRERTAYEVDLLEEPPHTDEGRAQLIEEPQISLVPSVPDHRENSEKARIIQEPAIERTPSGSTRLKPGELGGTSRGLDESQLGKRLAKRVRTMFQSLSADDPYQLLDVRPDASAEVITRAYFDLSLEFHPDRFFLLRSGDLKEKIYAIYRKISDAYDLLSDPRRRATHDAARNEPKKRRAEPPPAVKAFDIQVRDPKAKKFVDLANTAFLEGDLLTARLHFHLAHGYEANNAALTTALETVAKLGKPARPLEKGEPKR